MSSSKAVRTASIIQQINGITKFTGKIEELNGWIRSLQIALEICAAINPDVDQTKSEDEQNRERITCVISTQLYSNLKVNYLKNVMTSDTIAWYEMWIARNSDQNGNTKLDTLTQDIKKKFETNELNNIRDKWINSKW